MASPVEQRQRIVVIVDPYSSGRYLVHELQHQQWPMVGVQSSQDLADFWLSQYDESLFVKTIRHESLEKTVAGLAEFDVEAVLAGSEPGVFLTEDLAKHFKVKGNDAATKDWRRDKAPMQERLREVGLRAIHQIYSSDVDEILKWQKQWNKWPIIIKPSMSGGTDGVHWCHCEEDVRTAHKLECGKMNVNGVTNEKLLAQEYLDGIEYIVDCVSYEGKHVLSGIWVYQKTKDRATRSISYEYARTLESTGPEQDQLVPYVMKCLDALGIVHGPSHSEAIICDDGPCLVETGARLHGLKGPKLTEYATGIGTHELAVDVAVNGARLFKSLYEKGTRYSIKKWAFETMFRNTSVTGVLQQPLDVPEIVNLPSVTDIFPSIKPGEELHITRDLATAPGVILQVHPNLDRILADIEKIRQLEKTTLYQVKKAEASPPGSPSNKRTASPFVQSPVHEPIRKTSADSAVSDFRLAGLDEPDDLIPNAA